MKYDLEELIKENMNIQETPSQELKERVLCQEKEELTMQDKRKLFKFVPKVAAVAVAVVVATGGIAYAGTSLWNRYVAEDFGVAENDTLKKDLNEKGFAQQPQVSETKNNQVSVTDQDITVSVQQTLADEHAAYVCFEVKYGDQYHVVDKGATEISDTGVAGPEWVTFQMDSGMDLNYCGSISKIIDDHTILYDYFLTTSDEKDSFKDGRIKMNISAFTMDQKKLDENPEIIAKDGKWDLAWDLSVGTEKRVYHLDQTLTLGKDRVVLKDLTISPLSGELTMENLDGVSISEIGAVIKYTGDEDLDLDENGNLKIIRYIRTGGMEHEDKIREKLPEGQELCSLDTYALCLDDKDFEGMGDISFGSGDGDYLFAQFNKVLDVEKVTGARVAGQYIDLTSVSYETVQ